MNFRQGQHYVLLVLVMTALFTLGRQRSRDYFKIAIVPVCAAYALHWEQDMWFAALPAVAVIADGVSHGGANFPRNSKPPAFFERFVIAALAILLFVLSIAGIPPQHVLFAKITEVFPVKAADAIRRSHSPGPLYNFYAWGGFLAWYLPEYPVSIDERLDMYGQRINDLYFETATALRPLSDDPTYISSRTFLLKKESRLADVIEHSQGFHVTYSDDLTVVIERETFFSSPGAGQSDSHTIVTR